MRPLFRRKSAGPKGPKSPRQRYKGPKSAWQKYKENSAHITPLLAMIAPLLTLGAAGGVAWATLRQVDIAGQRGTTETFTRAVEQLSSDKLQIRLGGIYALERVSKESRDDYWPIMEILTSFVREQARWRDENTIPLEQIQEPPTDIVAVLTVIMRRGDEDRAREKSEGWRLDFNNADLRGASLGRAHLEGAYLRGVHLEGAYLSGAHLEEADLTEAHLERAWLPGAHLERAQLFQAHLERAQLVGAHLEETDLRQAHLEGAVLLGDLTQSQIDGAIGNASTILPEGLTRPAHWPAE